MRKSTIWILTLVCSLSIGLTQSVSVATYGISPNGVNADTEDLFDLAYNGMQNVGVGTQMYLTGTVTDGSLTTPTWTVQWAPFGSTAGFGVSMDMDTSTQAIIFVPDVAGVYYIEFADLGAAATLTVHAANYMGMTDGNCGMCHSDKVAEWEETGHSDMLVRGLNGTLSDHYGAYCIGCHTTGYDLNADNNGFDEHGFVYPDSTTLVDVYGSPDGHLFDGLYDLMAADYPDAFELANIQCEACHGPGSDHFGNTSDFRMQASLSTDNCAWCHDSGTHHVFPSQLAYSGHSNPPSRPSWSGGCYCHTPEGFIEYTDGETVTSHPTSPFSCAMCHDPHSLENPHQLRTDDDVELMDGTIITDGGNGKLCMNCHKTRRDADSYSETGSGGHYGPHYGCQTEMLTGENVITFGQDLPTSPHLTATEDACVTCHMWNANGTADDDGNIYDVGGHTFHMVDEAGVENVLSCAPCHGEIESFEEKLYWDNGIADHDGDGVNEGLMHEVDGLYATLAGMLPHADTTDGYDPHDTMDDTFTLTEKKAAYNLEVVYYDHSHGIHNPAFAVALLQVSIQALINNALDGQIVSVDDVPNDQGRNVKVIWDKFLDDGIANDPIDIYAVKRYDAYDDTWTNVGTLPADGSNRYAFVAPTLFDSTGVGDGMTTFKVLAFSDGGAVFESDPADGYSIDNLAPAIPTGVMGFSNLDIVQLIWDDATDADFNYFSIHRNGELIGYSTEASYVDVVADGGEYVYTIHATDINENVSEGSSPESVLAGLLGDVTGNFQIDILDVVRQVGIILGSYEYSTFEYWAGDLNEDSVIDVLDIIINVGIILGPDMSRGNMMTDSDVSFGNGSVMINSNGTIAGFQIALKGDFNLVSTNLPTGWEIHSNSTTILAFNMNGQETTESVIINLDGEFVVETALVTDWYENGIQAQLVFVPGEYSLSNAYPNPFNPTTTIEYGLPINSNVRIMVYDMLGRQVAELVNSYQTAGVKKITWTANDLPSGIYIVKMNAEGFEKTKKVMLVKSFLISQYFLKGAGVTPAPFFCQTGICF